jgi:protein involved in polysaccharide export with SLBB domain
MRPLASTIKTGSSAVVLMVAAGGARAMYAQATAATPSSTATVAGPPRTAPDSIAGSAILLPGDVVRLRIWREPDLSGDFPVDERGSVVFPKIGPTAVAQITTDSLKHLLVTTYSQYLRDPAIEVTFLRRVTILGAVKNPGLYPVDPTMTVSDAVALAGGPLPNGRPHNFELRRSGQRIDVDFNTTTPIGHTTIRSGDEIYIPERSWVSRNGPLLIGASITAVAIIVSAVIRY